MFGLGVLSPHRTTMATKSKQQAAHSPKVPTCFKDLPIAWFLLLRIVSLPVGSLAFALQPLLRHCLRLPEVLKQNPHSCCPKARAGTKPLLAGLPVTIPSVPLRSG